MRCDCCPLSSCEDVCPEADNEYGIEHKDGVLGCRHPRNWIDKRVNEYSEYLGEMGTDMGIEMSLSEAELNKAIQLCKHMIGLDHKKPYHRHGKAYYKPYRNYFQEAKDGNKVLDKLPDYIISRVNSDMSTWYSLTSDGLRWIGRELKITIKEG
ncbi:MAG: hypothetical protein ACI4HJ_04915 [Ruminococcus sp.]